MNFSFFILNILVFTGLSHAASIDDTFTEMDEGLDKVSKLCINGQGHIFQRSGVKSVGCTIGFIRDAQISKNSTVLKIDKILKSDAPSNRRVVACPIEFSDDLKSACTRFHLSMESCLAGSGRSTELCSVIAVYDATTPESIKSLCGSENRYSCVFHKKQLIKCYQAVKDVELCQNVAQKLTNFFDAFNREYPQNSRVAQSLLESCLEEDHTALDKCVAEARSYMVDNYTSDKGPCADLQGKHQGYCGDILYSRVKTGNVNDIARFLKVKSYGGNGQSVKVNVVGRGLD